MRRDVVLGRDGSEWSGEIRYLGDVLAQVIDKSKEALQLLAGQWRRPILQVGQSLRINGSSVRVDAKTQKLDLQSCEMALADIRISLA